MTDKIINDIDLCFDVRNHHELSPFIFFNDSSLYCSTKNSFTNDQVQDSSHSPIINQVIYELENSILFEKYYGDDKDEILEYNKSILNSLKDAINYDVQDPSIEKQFDHPNDIINDQTSSLRYFMRQFKKLLKRDFKQMPIPTARFPHYHQQTTNYFISDFTYSESTDTIQQDETKLSEILTIDTERKETEFPISFENLNEFYQIISKCVKAFSISPSFVISTLHTLDFALKAALLFKKEHITDENFEFNDFVFFNKFRCFISENSNEDEKIAKTKYFKLIMLIKLRLYLIIQRMHDCITVLLQFIIMEQEILNFDKENDNFPFKKLFNESLPETKKRSKIIENVSSDQIFDFYLSTNGQNDFILKKDGLFKINETMVLSQIDLKEEENAKIHQIIDKCNKNDIKMAFSNNILYILSSKDKKIHKFLIQSTEEKESKPQNEKKNINEKEFQEPKKMTPKKEKKKQRKIDRHLIEKFDKNLESISINLNETYPIISMDVYNNYLRILQRKNCTDDKTTFLITNVDMKPNSRTNFDVIEAFEGKEIKEKIQEIQIEINYSSKIVDACFSEDFLFVSFEDSLCEQWIIYQNGQTEKYKSLILPFLMNPYSRQKIDENQFLHVLEPVENDSVCINKMYLKETKHYIRSEGKIFIKYPYLQKLSDIVDNCSQFIINKEITKEITTEEYYRIKSQDRYNNDEKKPKKVDQIPDPFSFSVSPEEMSCVIQSLTSISSLLNNIKELVSELKDDDLKHFFVSLLIKMCGINLLYGTCFYYSSKDRMNDPAINRFKQFKSFIFDLYSLIKPSNSNNFEIMIRESIIFTFSLAGKFLFLPDGFDELHQFIHKLLFLNETGNDYAKRMLNSLSKFIFTYPSSLYFIDKSIYDHLFKFENVVNLHQLFSQSLYLIFLEERFANKVMNDEFISFIDPYFQSLIQYFIYILKDESIPIIKAEQLLSILIGLPIDSCFYSLMIEKNAVEIAPLLYNRIKKMTDVIEKDREFSKSYQDIQQQTVHKEIKIIESEHPFNYFPPNNETDVKKKRKKKNWWDSSKSVVENIATVEFPFNTDKIYCYFDNRCDLPPNYDLKIIDNDSKIVSSGKSFSFNQAFSFNNNKVKVQLLNDGEKPDKQRWGYKVIFIGVSFENPYYWLSNVHLNFYNHFVAFLTCAYEYTLKSTPLTKSEKDFNLILNSKIIQGIKFEDIDNYESNLKENESQNKPKMKLKRTLTRGISRGISYDTDNDSSFDDDYKKSFLKDLLTFNENKQTRGKQLLDYLYSKTAKQNRIRLNESTKSILIIERYLAACLFKQLGLINLCLKHINSIIVDNDIEIPNRLKLIMKMIYSLRQTLFFSYQKSKVASNSDSNKLKLNFQLFSEEIKRKCILLLYSDPILKFKEKGDLDNEAIESSAKSVFSFVTSEIPLSNISDLIDIRRKRLAISSQSIKYLCSFIDKDLFFESTKIIFAKAFNIFVNFYFFNGLSQTELDEFNKLYGSLSYKVIKKIYSKPSFSLICEHGFLSSSLFKHEDKESRLECSEVFKNIIENTKKTETFSREYTNFVVVCILLTIAAEDKNNELVNYIIDLLLLENIDFQSKRLILTLIPAFYQIVPENQKINDKNLAFSILEKNQKSPIIVRSVFYWLAMLINTKIDLDDSYYDDFILKVLKGIGRSFVGKSCLFIDESFQPFTHRQVAEGMISFIRLLINLQNYKMNDIIHEILSNKISKIKFDSNTNDGDELMIIIGLFASTGQILSSLNTERKIIKDVNWNSLVTIIGFNTTFSALREYDESTKKISGAYGNVILIDPRKIDLTDDEVNNLLQLHEIISLKYFNKKQDDDVINISETEIERNVLISTFYSFLPVIMQSQNNADLLMNEKNIHRSLSLFEFATKVLPNDENSILILSHYLEQAINSPLYRPESSMQINRVDHHGSFRFMKMNFGEIVYNNESEKNDLIKSNRNHQNLFICTRPFDSDCRSYFEIKINKIGNKQIFIGFIDSNDFEFNKAFGFGCTGQSDLFCRKSPHLSKELKNNCDTVMQNDWAKQTGNEVNDESSDEENNDENANEDENENEINIFDVYMNNINENLENIHKEQDKLNGQKEEVKTDNKNDNNNEKNIFFLSEGDTIGCYYTNEFVYLTLNGKLTPYRLFHNTLNSYVPFISIDHDEIELEITQNTTIIDENDNFEFIKIDELTADFFTTKDINKTKETENNYFSREGDVKEKSHFIGQQIYICKTISNEKKAKMETINTYTSDMLRYRENYGIIKEIIPIENNRFVSKLKIVSYDNNSLSNELIKFDIDSRYVKGIKTNFFNLIENRTNTKLGFNNTYDLKYLPPNLQKSSDFGLITNYLRSKTIKENSKSIAIIMTRYLVFILVDYLRFSKSKLIQDEGIETPESDSIIKGLIYSIPTITSFYPKFVYKFDENEINQYSIFHEEDKDCIEKNTINPSKLDGNFHKLPGFSKSFNKSFAAFFQLSEKIISPKFISKVMQGSIEKALNDEIIPCSSLYKMIPSDDKIESIYPLPKQSFISNDISYHKQENKRIVGYIPILLYSMPEILPSLRCDERRLRNSSEQVSYINFSTSDDIEIKWKYNISILKKMEINKGKSFLDYKNYKLKFGVLLLSKDLPESLLNNSLGFIQTLFNIFQAFNRSEILYDKLQKFLSTEFLEKFLLYAQKKNPLAYPFLQVIIVTLISRYGFSDSLFLRNANNASFILGNSSDVLFKIDEFPSGKNELPLLFSIYSNLSQTRIAELMTDEKDKDKISSLFEKYEKINNELFTISEKETRKNEKMFLEFEIHESSDGWGRYRWRNDDDSSNKMKKKNFRSIYLVYYYSYLLHSDQKLPYPMFLFVREWMMQHFGGFRISISKNEIDNFSAIKIDEVKEIVYKSAVFENDNDLLCSYQMINIYKKNSGDDDDNDEDNEYDNEDSEGEPRLSIDAVIAMALKECQQTENNDDNNDENNDKKNEELKNEKPKEEDFKVFVHQLNDDKQIEIPKSGECVVVSFPIEIVVVHEKGKKSKKFKKGDIYVVNFSPSEKEQKECFIDSYEQIKKDFNDFISLSKYDNALFDAHSSILNTTIENTTNTNTNETINNENNENINNNNNNNNDNINNENNNDNNVNDNNNDTNNENNNVNVNDTNRNENDDGEEDNEDSENYNDYQIYDLEKIPTTVSVSIPNLPTTISPRVISLRYSIITRYNRLIESMIVSYTLNDDSGGSYSNTNWWSSSSSHSTVNPPSQYMRQIIGPAYSMKTESKFRFINNILKNEKKESYNMKLIFNRFEDQKFLNSIENRKEKSSLITARPLFVQLLEQVDDNSISLLKVRGAPPFKVNLVGEGAIDGGGPSREIFSSLIIEMMNDHLGIFTFNPNRRHNNKETNQEDLIPNIKANFYGDFNDDISHLLSKRFTFAGALIACCIVSSLPQPLKLSSIIWDHLSCGEVSIESIYEVDNNFKTLIENCEDLENSLKSSCLSDEDFKNRFVHSFQIQNSFDELIEIVPSGSKIAVTKENLHEFIQLAKKARIHEFDSQLNDIKDGFDKIMSYKNITSILHPNELELLVCGEPSCSIEQMKKLTKISVSYLSDEKLTENDLIKMFWNVMNKMSPEDRMQFIKFSTGNLGLPAPGLKWDKDLSIDITSREEKEEKGKNMLFSSTCMSKVEIPFFETEDELEKMIRLSLKFSGMISDEGAHFEEVSTEFL